MCFLWIINSTPRYMANRKEVMGVSVRALSFIITQDWKQPTCPKQGDGLVKSWYSHAVEYWTGWRFKNAVNNTIELYQQTMERKIPDRELFLSESIKADKTNYAVGSRDRSYPGEGAWVGIVALPCWCSVLWSLWSATQLCTHSSCTLLCAFRVAVKQLLGEGSLLCGVHMQ